MEGAGADLICSSFQLNWMQIHTWAKKRTPCRDFSGRINLNQSPETANVDGHTNKVFNNKPNQSMFTVAHDSSQGWNNVICLDFSDFLPPDISDKKPGSVGATQTTSQNRGVDPQSTLIFFQSF